MATVTIYSKIAWRTNITKPWAETVYPSIIKHVTKDEPKYKDFVNITIQPLTEKNFQEEFLPLYTQQIASRENYHLDLNRLIQQQLTKLQQNEQYSLLICRIKDTNQIIGAITFRNKSNLATVAYRVFDRAQNRLPKTEITLDYIIDKELYTYFQSLSLQEFSHGKDTHPYINHLGLAMYKLKTGARPKIMPKAPFSEITLEKLPAQYPDQSTLLFTQPNSQDFFQSAYLINPHISNPNLINELEHVLNHSQIEIKKIPQ